VIEAPACSIAVECLCTMLTVAYNSLHIYILLFVAEALSLEFLHAYTLALKVKKILSLKVRLLEVLSSLHLLQQELDPGQNLKLLFKSKSYWACTRIALIAIVCPLLHCKKCYSLRHSY
jgi:hypothetical protein